MSIRIQCVEENPQQHDRVAEKMIKRRAYVVKYMQFYSPWFLTFQTLPPDEDDDDDMNSITNDISESSMIRYDMIRSLRSLCEKFYSGLGHN